MFQTSEIVAAVQSGADYQLFATPVKVGAMALGTHHKAMILVPVTIAIWLAVTFLIVPFLSPVRGTCLGASACLLVALPAARGAGGRRRRGEGTCSLPDADAWPALHGSQARWG